MSLTTVIIIVLALGMVLGGVLLLKKSAKKFNLTDEQLEKIKQRNQALEQKEAEDQER